MNGKELILALQRSMKPLKDKLLVLVTRAQLTNTNSTGSILLAQIRGLAGETIDKVPYLQHFGFTSNPPDGTQAIVVNIGANRDNVVIIATEKGEVRVKGLAKGEMAVYTDDGTYMVLKKDGQVEIKTATKVKIDVPDAEFTGNVKVKGNIEIDGTSKQTGAVTMEATLSVTGDVTIGGATTTQAIAASAVVASGPIAAAGGTIALADVKTKFNTHTHNENGTGGGVTNTPNVTI